MAQHWAEAPIGRSQIVLFCPTLDEIVSADHPVRLLDEILRQQDWSEWVSGRRSIHAFWRRSYSMG